VALSFQRISARAWYATAALVLATASSAVAQQSDQSTDAPQPDSTSALRLPQNPQVFGTAMPSIVKATAIVNGDVVTQTDVDQRLALLEIANGGKIPAEELDRLRQQVLRNLIDETLQIQAAKTEKITIKDVGHRPDGHSRRWER
jgi:peptidyl-prolyl cis-trans isomerase SurA